MILGSTSLLISAYRIAVHIR